MSPDDIKHFLVIYDIAGRETEVHEFGADYEGAQAAYGEAERAARGRANLDIVLLSADSLETLKRTHSSYFDDGGRRLEELLSA